jgi:hypothetical protein
MRKQMKLKHIAAAPERHKQARVMQGCSGRCVQIPKICDHGRYMFAHVIPMLCVGMSRKNNTLGEKLQQGPAV